MASLGGMQRVAVDLHAALGAHAEVNLFERAMRGSWKWRHFHATGFLTSSLWTIPRLVKQHKIDVVIFSSMVTAAAALPLRGFFQRSGCRTIAITHGLDVVLKLGLYQKYIVPAVFRMVDAVTPVSNATGEACLDRGLPTDKLYVVPNGVHPDRFDSVVADTDGLLAQGGRLPDNRLLLCSLGRHVVRKGFHWFIDRVMPQLPVHIHYWLAGDGPTTDLIRTTIQRRGLEDRVTLLGRISDEQVKALYQEADVFVMPNIRVDGDMEGFGVVLLEAGLCGLPALASDLEGMRDVLQNGVSGYYAGFENADAFVQIINQLDSKRETLGSLRESTPRYVLDTFSWSAVADRFVNVCRSLLGA
jgi:phosphatidyl-myo-inositol dimannoside synthase